MKLSRIFIASLLGASSVELNLNAPINLIGGKNGVGKSSIGDALRLTLCQDLGRIHLKKDAASLVTDGADSGVCQVQTSDGEDFRASITKAGALKNNLKGREADPRLVYALDGQRVAAMSDADRRAFLAGLLGITMDQKEVVRRLLEKGLDEKRVKRISSLLLMGFDGAMKDAAEKASQARGAWKVLTGENYGSVKAQTWAAPVVAFDAAELESMQALLASTEAGVGEAQQAVGALQQKAEQAQNVRTQLASLREAAGKLASRQAKLKHDEGELASWTAKLTEAEQKAGTAPRVGLVHDLARLVMLAWENDAFVGNVRADEALTAYETTHGKLADEAVGDAETRERLPSILKSVQLMQSAVNNARRDLTESESAAAQITALEAQQAIDFDAAALAAAAENLAGLQGLRTVRAKAVQAMLDAKRINDSAAEKTATAAAHHADVVAWDAIAKELSPEGVQAEMLTAAMQPLNDRLAQSAADLNWPAVVVHPDMRVTAAMNATGRPYSLLSVSEKWRCDAMLAEAVSFLSGLHLLVLDGMDVLDAESRGQLISWLDVLATTGEVDTVLVMATLKALPSDLPASFATHWIEAGHCGVELAQAA